MLPQVLSNDDRKKYTGSVFELKVLKTKNICHYMQQVEKNIV